MGRKTQEIKAKAEEQKKENRKISRRNIVTIVLAVISLIAYLWTEDEGLVETGKWLLMLFVLAALMRPVIGVKALKFQDGGFIFSLGIGMAITFAASYYLPGLGICNFDVPICIAGVIIPAFIVNYLCFNGKLSFKWDRDTFDRFLMGFVMFSIVFFIAFYFKGFRPGVDTGVEQRMDYGFVQTILRTKSTLPPDDMWYSGGKINYYYLGQACTAFLCNICFSTNDYVYNFMMCTVVAALFCMAFSLVTAVLMKTETMRLPFATLGGLVAGCATALAGNGDYVVRGFLYPLINDLTGVDYSDHAYWFADPTTYIGTYPDVPDKGKTEFPAYSAHLSDLHAHYCDLLFVLPLIMILFDYAFCKNKETEDRRGYAIKELFSSHVIMISLLTGLFRGVNYWDFAIYFVVAGAVILFCDLKRFGNFKRKLPYTSGVKAVTIRTLVKGVIIFILGTVVAFPFELTFEKISSKIKIAEYQSPLYKMAIIWGIPVVITLFLLFYIVRRCKWENRKIGTYELAVIAIGLCAIGLILTPEVIYIEDIYSGAYKRFNTMFKLTYQAFVMFGLLAGVTVGQVLNDTIKNEKILTINEETKSKPLVYGAKILYTFVAVLFIIIIGIQSTYTPKATKQWLMGEKTSKEERSGICATNYNKDNEERGAIDYLNNLPDKKLTVLQSAGTPYTDDDLLSVLCGVSTPIGWHVHEWLWRGDVSLVDAREEEVRSFYEDGSEERCREIIEKYDVDYIYAGSRERERYNIDYYGWINMYPEVWRSANGAYVLYQCKFSE